MISYNMRCEVMHAHRVLRWVYPPPLKLHNVGDTIKKIYPMILVVYNANDRLWVAYCLFYRVL